MISQNQHSSSTPLLDYLLILPSVSLEPTEYTLFRALQDLHALARRNFGQNRIFVPFSFILSSLAEAGSLDEVISDNETEGAKCVKMLLALAVNSIQKSKAAQRVAASSKV